LSEDRHYRPEIDGLRALAVIPVIFYHAGLKGFGAGFLGVDVFFVISGYLIAGILDREIQRGDFSVFRFYERRVRRILPALYLVVAASMVFGALWLLPRAFQDLAQSTVAVALFGSNVYFNKAIGYFTEDVEFWPLIHTWSLAVEEQFYAIFPLLLLLLRRAGSRWTFGVVAALSLASLAWAQWTSRIDPQADFYLVQFRAWELGAGALAALASPTLSRLGSRLRWGLAGLGAAMLALAFALAPTDLAPSLGSLGPVVAAALLVSFARSDNLWGRWLAAPPLVGVGLVSYSAYLWHQPIFAFLRYRFAISPGGPAMLLASLASFALAYVSWRFVERPFRDPRRFSRGFVFGATLTAGVALILAGRIVVLQHGLPARTPSYVPPSHFVGAYRDACLDLEAASPEALAANAACRLGRRDVAPDFLLIGDSHAASLADGIDLAAKEAARSGILLSANACPPLLGLRAYAPRSRAACRWQHDNLLKIVRALGVKLVVMHARWESLDEAVEVDDEAAPRKATAEDLRKRLLDTLSALSAAGARVVIVTDAPGSRYTVPDILQRKALYGLDVDERGDLRQFLFDNRTAFRLFAEASVRRLARVIDLYPFFCDEGDGARCRVAAGSRPYFFDHDHLSAFGALSLSSRLAEAFR
jgi:peptidoglycan/LPS O-acetylase OafA/YrhL